MKISDIDGFTWILFLTRGGAAQIRPDSRQQLINAERLGNVVVRSFIERGDLAVVFTSDRKNYDWNL